MRPNVVNFGIGNKVALLTLLTPKISVCAKLVNYTEFTNF